MPDGEQLKPRAPRTIRVKHVMGTVVGIDVRVPGPREVHYLAGTPVRRILVWAPPSGSLRPSSLTYDGCCNELVSREVWSARQWSAR
jgi:hypothetical protein